MAIKSYKDASWKNNGTAATQTVTGDLTMDKDIADTTPWGSSWDLGTELGGRWSFTGECNYDPTDTVQAVIRTAAVTAGGGLLSAIQVWEDASHYFGGSAFVTNATVRISVGSTDKLSFTLKGNGANAYT